MFYAVLNSFIEIKWLCSLLMLFPFFLFVLGFVPLCPTSFSSLTLPFYASSAPPFSIAAQQYFPFGEHRWRSNTFHRIKGRQRRKKGAATAKKRSLIKKIPHSTCLFSYIHCCCRRKLNKNLKNIYILFLITRRAQICLYVIINNIQH